MKPLLLILLATLALSLGSAGCSRRGSIQAATNTKVFSSAPAEVQAVWAEAVSALRTNDYVGSQVALYHLQAQPNLTPEQRAMADATLNAAATRMFDAAGRGDPAALKALEDMRQFRAQTRARSTR